MPCEVYEAAKCSDCARPWPISIFTLLAARVRYPNNKSHLHRWDAGLRHGMGGGRQADCQPSVSKSKACDTIFQHITNRHRMRMEACGWGGWDVRKLLAAQSSV